MISKCGCDVRGENLRVVSLESYLCLAEDYENCSSISIMRQRVEIFSIGHSALMPRADYGDFQREIIIITYLIE